MNFIDFINFIILIFLFSFIVVYGIGIFVLTCENFHRSPGTKRITIFNLFKESRK